MATTSRDRIMTLDVIRGIAVMGIFSVNVVGMAMIESAYFYPPDYGFENGYDKVMWALNSIFVDGRFRSLFSILFGASMIVVIESAVAAGRKGWQIHYPRMIVLLMFGLAHYYLLWWGDILANYAMVGMIAYVFWRLSAKWSLIVAVLALSLANVPPVAWTIAVLSKIERIEAGKASAEERKEIAELLEQPSAGERAETLARDKQARASIAAHATAYTQGRKGLRPFQGVFAYGIETLGLMLLGMALYKSGFLTGAWSRKRYAGMAAGLLGLDLAVHSYAVWATIAADFARQVYLPWIQVFVSPLHPIGAVGYAALFILLFSQRSALADRLAAVGRSAFSNYLGPTLLGTLLFFGSFGGLYGELSRGQAWLIVPVVWAIMLIWSPWWLARYHYGPFEWAWRSLSRWERQPMRRALVPPVGAAS